MAALSGLGPGRRAMKPLIAVAVCVALIAGFFAWRSRPRVAEVAPTASVAASPGSAAGLAGPASLASASPSTLLIVVAVQGRVRHPGLVELPPGSRVADAIAAAGGVLPGTDLSYVNLAQKVVDGQLIVIAKSGPMGGSGGAGGAQPGGAAPGQPLNLNTATTSDLDTLPGIGPALAARIIAYRAAHGSFHSVDELRNVPGIGDAKFAEIKDLVTV